jgi:hypothetical protein
MLNILHSILKEVVFLTLVDIGLGVVGRLVDLVSNGILGGGGTGAQACVGILGNLFVGLFGSSGTGALDGLGNVVGGVLQISS